MVALAAVVEKVADPGKVTEQVGGVHVEDAQLCGVCVNEGFVVEFRRTFLWSMTPWGVSTGLVKTDCADACCARPPNAALVPIGG